MLVVLIIPTVGSKANILHLRDLLISYVGKRMVEEDVDDKLPGIVLNKDLEEEDKEKMSNMMPDSVGLIFIEGEDNGKKYIDTQFI